MREEKTKTDVKSKSIHIDLPYNIDVGVLGKILDDLKTTGNEGINLKTLWANTAQTKNPNRRYTLNFARFLNLIDTDETKVWLTNFGRSAGFVSGDKKNILLAQNMPETYKTMLKWIKISPSQEMFTNELKVQFVNTFGQMSSPIILDRSVASFLQYCRYIGVLDYKGKGRGTKATLTDFGKKVFDLPIEEPKRDTLKQEKLVIEEIMLSEEAAYPIKIITRDRTFDWDIKTDADLTVMDSVINSIKQSWKDKKPKKSTEDDKPSKAVD